MTTQSESPLNEAARAVTAARIGLQHIDARIAELREKSRDLDELKAAVAQARERRAQLLEEALLAGKKANTDEADKAVAKALAALQKREDEITAVERALATLEYQRQEANAALDAAQNAYLEARGIRVLEFVNDRIAATGEALQVLARRIQEARNAVTMINPAAMPAAERSRWMSERVHYSAIVENLVRDVPVALTHPHGCDQKIYGALDADLKSADELAGIVRGADRSVHQLDTEDDADAVAQNTPQASEQRAARMRTVTLTDRDEPGVRGAA